LSFLVELLFEFIIQFVLEALVEAGAHTFKRDRAPVHPVLAVIGYVILGGLLGWLSFLVLPQQLISHPYASIANLILTPIAVGLSLGAIGAWRAKRGSALVRLDKFAYGYAFALAFALVRFGLGTAG
jgi:VIT1/CCC1 family predicted Fe2+/Mn2+ transporter